MRSDMHKYWKAAVNLLTAGVILAFTVFLLPKLLGFFMPFVIGWIIAMIANPLVHFFEKHIKIRRKAGSAIVIITVLAGVILLGYVLISRLISEGAGFLQELPALWKGLEKQVDAAGENLMEFYARFPQGIRDRLAAVTENLGLYIGNVVNSLSVPTVSAVGNFARNIPSVLIGTIMCLLSSYFFVADKENIGVFLKKHVPEGIREKGRIMSSGLTGAVGGYFAAQFRIECVIYVILFAGLLLLGVRYSFLIAFLIAALDFLPVFGAGAVLWPWALFELLTGEFRMALSLMIIWGVTQLLRQIIQPKFVGDSIGLPPVPTLFLLYIGYKVGSVAGMILAVPVGIVVLRMYEAGLFETTRDSLRLLIHGFNRFRRLQPEDLAVLQGPEESEKETDEGKGDGTERDR